MNNTNISNITNIINNNIPTNLKNNIFRQNLILLIGKSGSGKSTITKILNDEYNLKNVDSFTTRPKRYEQEKGHIFISDKEFDKIKLSDMIAYTEYGGYKYCATKKQLDTNDIYIIDLNGLKNLKYDEINKKVISVYITASSKICLNRMLNRGNSYEEAIKRIEFDEDEFKRIKEFKFDCVLSNNSKEDLTYCVEKIYNLYLGR